jgi:hypothetical protein
VESMNPDVSSHGPRRAVINEANAAGARLPAIAAFSGHAPEDYGLSHGNSVLQYLSGSAQNATPVAAFTVGWPMSPSGVYTCTPQFPSLLALEKEQDYGSLPLIADAFFDIFDEVTPWLSYEGGRLRGLVDSMLAEQIMFFERRKNRYGSSFIPVSKLVGVVANKLRTTRPAAEEVLCRWGTKLHSKFIADNQRSLVDSSLVTTLAGISSNVAELGGSVASLTAAIAAMAQQQAALMVQQQSMLQSIAAMQTGGAGSAGSTSFMQALPVEAFVATTSALDACAASAAAYAARLRAAGSHLVIPASSFPHSEPQRRLLSSASSSGGAGGAAAAAASAAAASSASALNGEGGVHAVLAAASAASARAALPSAALLSVALPSAAPALPSAALTSASAALPSAALPSVALPSAAPALPSAALTSASAASACGAPFMQPLVPVVVDSTAGLSDLYMQYIQAKLSRRSRDTFSHSLDQNQRTLRTRDASAQTEALSKQKAAKIANGLAAMDALATCADFEALRTAYGSTDHSVRQAAHHVCRRLETLLLARLVFMQQQLKLPPVVPARLTPNAYESRVLALCAAVSQSPNGAAEIEGFKASFVLRPKEDFWGAARGGAFGIPAADAAKEAAEAIAKAARVKTAAEAEAAAAGDGGGAVSANAVKRAREMASAAEARMAAESKKRQATDAAAREARRLQELTRVAAAQSAAGAAALARPVKPSFLGRFF